MPLSLLIPCHPAVATRCVSAYQGALNFMRLMLSPLFRRRRQVVAALAARVLLFGIPLHAALPVPAPYSTREKVGIVGTNRVLTPVLQTVTPAGLQVDLPGLRPQALALSPDGRILVTSGKTSELVVVDPATGKILQRVPFPSDKWHDPQPDSVSPQVLEPDKEAILSFTGIAFSPAGDRIYLSNVNGSIKVFAVDSNSRVSGLFSIALPNANAPRRKEEIPAGLTLSPDGKRIYVALNLSNRVAEIDAATGKVIHLMDVGVAPFDVRVVGGKLYVSNWGGRRPGSGDLTGPAGRGTVVRVDAVQNVANEGSVTVLDLATGKTLSEVVVGRHASALALHPWGRYLVVANAASDTLSVIDTRTDKVVESICAKPNPAELFGASPNALAFDSKGRTLFVANGTQNALAVIQFKAGQSKWKGLIPVGWFPGAVVFDAPRQTVHVANIKGHGPGRPRKSDGTPEFNSHQYHGSLSLVPVPKSSALPSLTATAWSNFHREQIALALQPPRPGQTARVIPERIGEPSRIKHVVYIIKENRTYDQVLGDVPSGNGDPSLCIFGEKFTPNQHRLVKDFVLLDNTYCAGILSADGHQWSTSAFGTDYLERSFAGWPRSYPDGMGEDEADALAYAPSGFLWDNAVRHRVSLRDYGEFAIPTCRWADPKRKGSPGWTDYWNEFQTGGGEVVISSQPAIESLRPFVPTNSVGWEMAVPDVWRARFFTNELREFTARGEFPQLTLICLPDDHTSGGSHGSPTPGACVADNDLAFGQIVEALSRSPFWKEMVIFGIEDDPQAGWDHVSGYRTTAYCIGPYVRRGQTVPTQYSTVSMIRTIEQILGMPPMNQFDAAATPMTDCFTETPDFTSFTALPNQVPLDQMNPAPHAIMDPVLRRDALVSARLPLRQPDRCPEDVLNRILWRAMKGTSVPYPAWAITAGAGDDDD